MKARYWFLLAFILAEVVLWMSAVPLIALAKIAIGAGAFVCAFIGWVRFMVDI